MRDRDKRILDLFKEKDGDVTVEEALVAYAGGDEDE